MFSFTCGEYFFRVTSINFDPDSGEHAALTQDRGGCLAGQGESFVSLARALCAASARSKFSAGAGMRTTRCWT